MPSLYAPGFQALPPTPPRTMGGPRMDSDPPFYTVGHNAFPPRYSQTGCEFIEQFSQSNCYAKPPGMNRHNQALMRTGRDLAVAPPAMGHHQQASQPMFGPVSTAAMLPPIRTNVQLPPMENAVHYPRPEPVGRYEQCKEEKTTGGVAAHLDYEMEQMSDFVAEMAYGMYGLYINRIDLCDIDLARSVHPGTSISSQSRKFVFQILSSTRLPSSTILLGLYYLATRMQMLSSARVYPSGHGQVSHLLTVALLLGSKFLDDNTFQNKSWAEVSGIPVAELNSMELDWLFAFDWKIHDRIYEKQDGLASWISHWEKWRAKATARAHESSRQALAPINTNSARTNVVSKPLMSPDGPIPPQYQRTSRFESSWLNPAASEYSPPSAPHSGPTTPDYYAVGPWAYPPPPYSRTWMQPPSYLQPSAPSSQPPSYHQTPYALPFAQSVWTGHGSSCGCMYCAKHLEHYMCANAFGSMQPIVAG